MRTFGEVPDIVAEVLANLYTRSYAGRKDARFRLSLKSFKTIARVNLLTEEYIRKVQTALVEMEPSYILINMNAYLIVVSVKSLASSRRLTNEALEDALSSMCSKYNRPITKLASAITSEDEAE